MVGKCPHCHNQIEYDPSAEVCRCPSCSNMVFPADITNPSVDPVEEVKKEEKRFFLYSALWGGSMVVLTIAGFIIGLLVPTSIYGTFSTGFTAFMLFYLVVGLLIISSKEQKFK